MGILHSLLVRCQSLFGATGNSRAVPKIEGIVKVTDASRLITTATRWKEKTHGYKKDHEVIISIKNHLEVTLDLVFEDSWLEIAPGIHTCEGKDKDSDGMHSYRENQRVRIDRHACPVYLLFSQTNEYADYDDRSFTTYESQEFWIKYEAG